MNTIAEAPQETATPSKPTIPPFLVEIRSSANDASPAWTVFAMAHSEEQARSKCADYRTHYPEYEFRATPHDWKRDEKLTALEIEAADLRKFKASVLKHCGTDDPEHLGLAVKAAKELPKKLEAHQARANKAESALMEIQGNAPAEDPEIPFKVGDEVEDIHTKIRMKVTAVGRDCAPIGRAKTPAFGFDWEASGGLTGHCPVASVSCFRIPPKGRKRPKPAAKHKAPAKSHAQGHAHSPKH